MDAPLNVVDLARFFLIQRSMDTLLNLPSLRALYTVDNRKISFLLRNG